MKFGTWRVTCLCRLGSLKIFAIQLLKNRWHFAGVHHVRPHKDVTETARGLSLRSVQGGMAIKNDVDGSKMSHLRCVYINNRCGYQSITQQYLKKCFIKDEVNYMFRPNVAIIRFSSESMVVVLYRIGMGMSRW